MKQSIFDNLSEIAKRRKEISDLEAIECRFCGSHINVIRRGTGTAYHHEGEIGSSDDPNFDTLCADCWIESDEYWNNMWNEYYNSIHSY